MAGQAQLPITIPVKRERLTYFVLDALGLARLQAILALDLELDAMPQNYQASPAS